VKPLSICEPCLEKQRRIDELVEENRRLKAQLHYRTQQQQEGFFGSSTPSAQHPLKPNTPAEGQSRRGGRPKGHPGKGRQGFAPQQAARVVEVDLEAACPDCGRTMEDKGVRCRSVLEIPPPRPEPILYRLHKYYCPHCHKAHQAQAPAVLPKARLGNQLVAHIAFLHYVHGIPLGRLCDQMGLELGSVVPMLHRLASLFQPVMPHLTQRYRRAPVRHADETSWRTDGRSGYAWLFATPDLSLFLFRPTRSARVPGEVLGTRPLSGVLVVDRYNGYNQVPCQLQYCYAHLLREVEDLAKQFPHHAEVRVFTATLIPLLAEAMHLRGQPLADPAYYRRAAVLKKALVAVCQQPAQHLGIRRIQDIFRDHPQRLYHWVKDRAVPPDNNRAERELRPTVIARKVSFGSQSEAGAQTRETLMTLLHTLKKRQQDAEHAFKSVLDRLATDIKQDPVALLFPADSR
jgi:transposase